MRWLLWPGRRRKPPDDRAALGRWGEDVAVRELEKRGYAIVERRARGRRGELDLVAADGDTLVFVEVKTRHAGLYGGARDAISRAKGARLIELGRDYLTRHGRADADWRIDVVAIDVGPKGGYTVDIIPNALTE